MDLGCFFDWYYSFGPSLHIEWLCIAYKQDEEEIALWVQLLLPSCASLRCEVFVFYEQSSSYSHKDIVILRLSKCANFLFSVVFYTICFMLVFLINQCDLQSLFALFLEWQLEHLKQRSLLHDVDLRSERISMHDLYLEYAKLEAMGSFNESPNLRDWMWVYIKNSDFIELESKPKGGCWYKLIRVTIIHSSLGLGDHGGIVG